MDSQEAGVREVGGVGPVLEVGRGEKSNGEFRGVGDDHDPFLGGGVPDYFWVTELGRANIEDGIGGIGGERIASVDGVGDVLVLKDAIAVDVFCECVYCYHAVGLIREKT